MGHSTYARGGWALGECARSGRKMLLRNMVADGYYPNLIVDPEWYEPKHPQESLPSVRDPVALFRPAPDRDQVGAQLSFTGAETQNMGFEIGGVSFLFNFTEYNDPFDWTLIENWRFADGDLVAIGAAFNGDPDGRPGVIWSPDGTVITLASNEDFIRSFTCSTPFDPSTATLVASRAVSNPGHMFANRDGDQIWVHRSPDTYANIPASGFVVSNDAETSDITKAQLGFSGSSDISVYPRNEFDNFLVDGPITDYKRVTFGTNGDLDDETLGTERDIASQPSPWIQNSSIMGSKINKAGTRIYRGRGATGVEILEMSTPFDEATLNQLSVADIEAEIGFRPESIHMNPDDTREAWITGDTGGLELARMRTNVDL